MTYLLDANVLIQAKNREYGFDFCPAFWDWLIDANANGLVLSVEAVHDELVARDDDLSTWATGHRELFLAPTEAVVRTLGAIQRWSNESPDYDQAAKDEFADAADSVLIAHAVVGGYTVATHETASDSRKRIKIPNAAAAHGVKVMNPYLMLRTERARFILERAA